MAAGWISSDRLMGKLYTWFARVNLKICYIQQLVQALWKVSSLGSVFFFLSIGVCLRPAQSIRENNAMFYLKGLCHGSPVHFVQFCQLLALNRYGT